MVKKLYFTAREVSDITGLTIIALWNQRHEKRGIPYVIMGGHSIRYRAEDVSQYVAYLNSKKEAVNA